MLQIVVLSLFAFGIGIVLLLWGYRAFLAMLPIFGFFAGLWLGAYIVELIFGGGFFATATGLVVGLVTGIVFALLSYLFYFFGVAVVAAIIGYILGYGLMSAIGFDINWLAIVVGILVGIVVMVLAVRHNLQKYVIIGLTALAGANALVLAPLLLFGRVSPEEASIIGNTVQPVLQDSWLWLLIWIALAAVGIVYQVRTNKVYRFDPEEYEYGWGLPQ